MKLTCGWNYSEMIAVSQIFVSKPFFARPTN